ncbi:MAG: response regulator [Methylomarinum sp.]|nr:response regulator [Methylomarinum sp.]
MMVEEKDNKAVETILLADDNPDNLKVMGSMLEQYGYGVRVATNGNQAYSSIKTLPPDLVLLDIHMPGLDGYELCEKLKQDVALADIPVIFISALSETYNKVKGFELGAVDFIVKPFELEEVKVRVKTHLKLRQQMQEIKSNNKSMVDRELRIIELKQEVNDAMVKAGDEPIYLNVWDT